MSARRVRSALAAMIAFAALIPLLNAGPAYAHPLGNFTVNRYARIELYEGVIRLHYVLDFAEIPTFQLKETADTDRDDRLSQAELDAYGPKLAASVLRNFDLTADGKRLDPRLREQRLQSLPGQGGLEVMRAVLVFDAPVSQTAAVAVGFTDRNYADRAGWKEIVVRPSAGAQTTFDARFRVERSDELLSYPAESLTSAPDDREVSVTWLASSGAQAPGSIDIKDAEGRKATGLARLIEQDGSLGLILLSLFVAFVLGAQHAIGPGHGKSMVGAYLVGSRGKPKHAIALGLTVTATHTSTVYLMGFVTLAAAEFIAPERLYLYLGVASGVLVVVLGVALFISRVLSAYRKPREDGAHRHGMFGRAHSHGPAAAQEQEHHVHDAAHEHSHPHDVATADNGVTWRSLLALGVSGGLLPCPSAIVVMLAAISFGKILFGMLLIVAFSFGLAVVLSAIGLVLVLGSRASRKGGRVSAFVERPLVGKLVTAMPVVSALGVMLAGIYITYQAWNQPGI